MSLKPLWKMSMSSGHHRERSGAAFRLDQTLNHCVDWIVAGAQVRPSDVQNQLLDESLTKTSTLIVRLMGSSLGASAAVTMTSALWAYAWLVAELVIGIIRLSMAYTFTKAEPSRRSESTIARILLGFTATIVLSAGLYKCVESGQWPLIAMSGIGLATLIGATSSRSAATSRYGAILICILTLPFTFAALTSPIPYVFILGIQIPLSACSVIFVMHQNHRFMLKLSLSERENLRLAQHDPLTGLPNRVMNLKRFEELLASLRAGPGKLPQGFIVFCLDLDGFKDVNDGFGHNTGDALLIAVASRLRESVRSHDFVSRIGGDEFVILLPSVSAAEAAMIAERIISSVAAPFDVGHQVQAKIGISIGSARAPLDGETADALMRSADEALYEAKSRGKNVYVPYEAPTAIGLAPAVPARLGAAPEPDRHLKLMLHTIEGGS